MAFQPLIYLYFLKKRTLLYIIHDIQLGGVEVALVSAIPKLSEHYDLTVAVLGQIDPKMISHLSDSQKSCFKTFDYPLISYPFNIFRIAFSLLKMKPDIMISSLWRASLAGRIVKAIDRTIVFIPFIHSTTFFHLCDKIFTLLAIRSADQVFTDSSAATNFIQKEHSPGCPVTAISFFTQKSPAEKSNPPLSGDVIRFMFLGRLNPVKNLPLAIDTIGALRSRGLNAHLDIFGRDDGMLADIQKHIARNNLQSFVKFQGELNADQKMQAFREHHFLIQLSFREGMAMSVAEAMQNGLVCFVTPVGEIQNYAEDMHTAVFANTGSEEEWAASLEKLETCASDPIMYQQIANNCFEHFKEVVTYADSLTAAIDQISGGSG